MTNDEYMRQFPHLRYRPFAGRGVCTVGLGACRERGDEAPQAVATAVALGCNLLDTAPHYHGGAHERCMGDAVRLVVQAGICSREALIVNTQVGRVPELIENDILTLGFGRLKRLVEERFVSRGIFRWQDLAGGAHTIAPGYIRHSVEQTLARTGLDNVDCVFLDSLTVQRKHVSPIEFQRRVITAFETLEALCESGVMRCYGISTDVAIDLKELMQLARTASGPAPRLRALRAPYSLLRHEDMKPLIEEAAALGLHVFAAGCLDGGTPRYQFPDELEAVVGDLSDTAAAIQWTQSAPGVGTALFGTRDARHIRANIAAAALPPLRPKLYSSNEGAS